MSARSLVLFAGLAALAAAVGGPACTDGPAPPAPPPCDEKCKDGVALRGLRETMKLAFNLTLQGKPVGRHDVTVPCVRGGSARIFGEATSNAVQGATEVSLTYVFERCAYVQKDDEAPENYDVTITGTIEQRGVIAVQPTATTALLLKSAKVTISGSVYDPPEPYEANACELDVVQNGNHVSGRMCGRDVGFDF